MQKNFYVIPNYILNLILPKCVLLYGESIATIYLQISLYINNQDNCTDWRKGSCWIGNKKLSKNTGYNERVIKGKIKILEKLNLISINRNQGIKFFRLRNNQFSNMEDILQFNNEINSILYNEVNFSNELEIKINKLEKLVLNENLIEKFIINDINLVRNSLLDAESIFKGSSLFYVNCILQDVSKNDLQKISEIERALRIGSSQSTLSRYVKKYKEFDIIDIIDNRGNQPNILNYNNIAISVVRDVEMEKNCPICKQEFNSEEELINHISNNKDEKYILLKFFKTKNKNKTYEQVFIENKTDIMECNESEDKIEIETKIENSDIGTETKIESIQKEGIQTEGIQQTENLDFENIKTENAPDLVNYFYDILYEGKVQSPFYPKEASQIKNLLKKKNNAENIKLTMRYLHRKGNLDLKYINTSINDAIFEDKALKEINIDGTAAFLVNFYYIGMEQELNLQTFVHDIKKVIETINGIGYEKTKRVVEFLIRTNCPTLNYIGSKITEALKSNNQSANPCLNEGSDREVIGIKSYLRDGDKIKSPDHINIAKEMFLSNDFNKKFDNFEWAFKIGLELDEELYLHGIQNKKPQSIFQIAANDITKTDEIRTKWNKFNIKYEAWLSRFCQSLTT